MALSTKKDCRLRKKKNYCEYRQSEESVAWVSQKGHMGDCFPDRPSARSYSATTARSLFKA